MWAHTKAVDIKVVEIKNHQNEAHSKCPEAQVHYIQTVRGARIAWIHKTVTDGMNAQGLSGSIQIFIQVFCLCPTPLCE